MYTHTHTHKHTFVPDPTPDEVATAKAAGVSLIGMSALAKAGEGAAKSEVVEAPCCSVLQCVAVCCRVLQCVALFCNWVSLALVCWC